MTGADPRDYPLADEIRLHRKLRYIAEAVGRVLRAQQMLIATEHHLGMITDSERDQRLEAATCEFDATLQRAADAFARPEAKANHGI